MNNDVEAAIQYVKKYLEDLLSFYGLNTDVYATTEDNEVIELNIPSTHLNGFLIGQRGETMRSMQFLVSSALKNQNYTLCRVNVDVAEYKKQRADRLAETVESEAGLASDSVGEGRDRHIVLKLAE